MQVVVTGATSFIGAATVKKLMEAGHQVFAVVRPASSNMKHLDKLGRRGSRRASDDLSAGSGRYPDASRLFGRCLDSHRLGRRGQ